MKKMRNPIFAEFPWLKYGVYAAMLVLAYKAIKSNDGTLAGNADGTQVKFDSDKAIDVAMGHFGVSPVMSPHVKKLAKIVVDRAMNPLGIRT